MKNIALVILILVNFQGFAQRKPKISGNRNVVEVREELPAFDAIELNDDLEILLQSSSTNGYSVVADDNLIDILKFKVEGGILTISSFYSITAKKKMEITINYDGLTSITLHDGKMKTKDILSAESLHVATYGFSKIELNAKAPLMNIIMEGNSSGDFNLDSDSLSIVLKDKIDARIYSVGERNTVEMHKNALASLEGTSEILQVRLHGSAKLKAERMEATAVMANLEETTSAWLYPLKDFQLSSKGTSHTYLYGDAQITILEFLDTSELHKRKN